MSCESVRRPGRKCRSRATIQSVAPFYSTTECHGIHTPVSCARKKSATRIMCIRTAICLAIIVAVVACTVNCEEVSNGGAQISDRTISLRVREFDTEWMWHGSGKTDRFRFLNISFFFYFAISIGIGLRWFRNFFSRDFSLSMKEIQDKLFGIFFPIEYHLFLIRRIRFWDIKQIILFDFINVSSGYEIYEEKILNVKYVYRYLLCKNTMQKCVLKN